ncbi:hypothetical protein [Niveibacterium sp. SC-1]|uniref:hypothetical protein n=1 Tax=Niveibacterium sp. SC-1 TaxID=3135646 RepID=UPI00311E2869
MATTRSLLQPRCNTPLWRERALLLHARSRVVWPQPPAPADDAVPHQPAASAEECLGVQASP